MKLQDIFTYLDTLSPFELQESWDNSGLLVGNKNQEISKIVLSIDVDEKLLDTLDNNTLLITHHPLMIKGIQQLNYTKYPANLLQKMVLKNISHIAMHTNFDKTHLNKFVATEILGYKIVKEEDFILYLEVNEPFETFAKKVSLAFQLSYTKVVKAHNIIQTAALTTGSGCSLMRQLHNVDCFLTGDIKYHDAMEAKTIKLSLIDIGHYESEVFFAQILQNHLKNLGLEVIISQSENPFTYL
ncbi:FIG137478: Hypothetical protein [hydrothermal vent metagenome]|uniref:Nif3-like dinuclear metal center hexameric protein n=1 Tax=hydrothermal vent metagenome TaxID=652676 RepID=A0A1W1D280_9ZZZZ